MTKFIHSSDLHLGKRFGNVSGDLPGRSREARHAVLSKLAEHALANGADTILLAGDTFDTRIVELIGEQGVTVCGTHALPGPWRIS